MSLAGRPANMPINSSKRRRADRPAEADSYHLKVPSSEGPPARRGTGERSAKVHETVVQIFDLAGGECPAQPGPQLVDIGAVSDTGARCLGKLDGALVENLDDRVGFAPGLALVVVTPQHVT